MIAKIRSVKNVYGAGRGFESLHKINTYPQSHRCTRRLSFQQRQTYLILFHFQVGCPRAGTGRHPGEDVQGVPDLVRGSAGEERDGKVGPLHQEVQPEEVQERSEQSGQAKNGDWQNCQVSLDPSS